MSYTAYIYIYIYNDMSSSCGSDCWMSSGDINITDNDACLIKYTYQQEPLKGDLLKALYINIEYTSGHLQGRFDAVVISGWTAKTPGHGLESASNLCLSDVSLGSG